MFKNLGNAPHREGDELMGPHHNMRDLDERDAELLERLANVCEKEPPREVPLEKKPPWMLFPGAPVPGKVLPEPSGLSVTSMNRLVATRPEIKL